VSYFSFDVEPFSASLFSHANNTAWPPVRSVGYLPINLFFSWIDPSEDEFMFDFMKNLAANMTAFAEAEGQDVADAPIYGNYALGDTPTEAIWGANLPRLKEIRKAVDPSGVMNLAGGFRF
jgi:hypothetical protein